MSRYVTDDERLTLAVKLGQMRVPDHPFLRTTEGCGRCSAHSPFRWSEEKHPYVIEEEPC